MRTGAALGPQHHGGRAVRHRATVVEPQGIGDEPALHHRLERDGLLEVRERVPRGVRVVLDGDQGDLLEREPAALHRRAGDEPGQRRHRRAIAALVGIDRAPDDLRDARRGQVRHLLAAHHEHGILKPGGDGDIARVHGRHAGGGRRLHADGRHVGQAEVRGDERAEIPLAGELLGVHRGDDDRPRPLDPGVGQRQRRRLRHQRGQALLPLAEASHPCARDPHVRHAPN